MNALLYSLEVTLDFSQDFSDFLAARIKSYSPEMIRIGLGDEYKKYEKIKNEVTNLYEKLDTLLTPNGRSILEEFYVQLLIVGNIREAFFYKQGVLEVGR
mgnify:CR=1 FL=1